MFYSYILMPNWVKSLPLFGGSRPLLCQILVHNISSSKTKLSSHLSLVLSLSLVLCSLSSFLFDAHYLTFSLLGSFFFLCERNRERNRMRWIILLNSFDVHNAINKTILFFTNQEKTPQKRDDFYITLSVM